MQVEARFVQEGDTLWHPSTEQWVTVTEVRRVPNTMRWLCLEVQTASGKILVLYAEDVLKIEVRRPGRS